MPPAAMSQMTLKRIQRELSDLKHLKKDDLGDIVLEPTDNLQMWTGSIPGPQGSVYEGGVFKLDIQLPNDYPFTAPRVSFKTKIYHMNISEQGGICIDILKSNWSPALSLFKVMLSLSSLLTDPNPRDPLVPNIATQYTRNRKLHDTTAREWTRLYATVAKSPKPTSPPIPTTAPIPINARTARSSGRSTVSNAAAGSSRPMANRAAMTTVVVIDSDEEVDSARAPKRKRGSGANASATAGASSSSSAVPTSSSEVLEIVDSDEEPAAGAIIKRSRTQRTKPPSTRSASGSGAGGIRRSTRRGGGDPIVIDD